MLIHDIKPPLKRQLKLVQKKTIFYWRWLKAAKKVSLFGIPLAALGVLILASGFLRALVTEDVEMAVMLPRTVVGEWKNVSALEARELTAAAQSPEFSRLNSGYPYAEFSEINIPEVPAAESSVMSICKPGALCR